MYDLESIFKVNYLLKGHIFFYFKVLLLLASFEKVLLGEPFKSMNVFSLTFFLFYQYKIIDLTDRYQNLSKLK